MGKPAQDRSQTVQTPQGNQVQRNWGQNRQQPQPQMTQQRQGGRVGNRPQQQPPRPYVSNYQSTGQNMGWQRRSEDRGAGYTPPPRFGQSPQYRPFRQGMNQYQSQQKTFRPQGLGQRYQQNQQGFGFRPNFNQQAYRSSGQENQNRNVGQSMLNPPEDIVGKYYVCSGQDHVAPRCQAFGEERKFDFSKGKCTNRRCVEYLGYHAIACRDQ